MTQIQNLRTLIELAQSQGAKYSEVYQVSSLSRPVFFEGNRLKQIENSQAQGTALRIWYEGRPGVAVAYGKFDPQLLVQKAIAISQLNSPEIAQLAPTRTQIIPNQDRSIETKDLIELGQKAIAKIREHYPETICSAELDCETENTTLINSQGLNCRYTETSLSYFLGVELVKGDDFLGVYDGETSKNTLNCDRVVENILTHLDWSKTNVASPQGKVPVLLTANAATLLWDLVASALNGKRVGEKSSPWSGCLGKTIANPKITICQNPSLSPYNSPFDDEGVPTQELKFIEDGILKKFYCDLTSAQELQIASTGNGFRNDLGSYPQPSLINLVINPGESSFEELITKLDNGIIIDQFLGGGADISGDFSLNVELGYRVSNGEIVGRIKDTAVSGNIYQIIKGDITLGNAPLWNGSCKTPSVLVTGFSVTS